VRRESFGKKKSERELVSFGGGVRGGQTISMGAQEGKTVKDRGRNERRGGKRHPRRKDDDQEGKRKKTQISLTGSNLQSGKTGGARTRRGKKRMNEKK